jgi:nucleoside-triphosphatase THEP1
VLHAVLTGDIHIGKTTVCLKLADWARQHSYTVCGILTQPILDDQGTRLGLTVLDLASSERRELARIDPTRSCSRSAGDGPRVGPYRFEPASLRWASAALERAVAMCSDLLIVDEVGRLELEQGTGLHKVLGLMATSAVPRTLWVVRRTLLHAFQRRLPGLCFVVFEATEANRGALHLEIAQQLFERPPSG